MKNTERQAIMQAAAFMCTAARTAPKARGVDNIVTAVISGKTKDRIVAQMRRIGRLKDSKTFIRDSQNLKDAVCAVLIGTKISPVGVRVCGLCGYKDCQANKKANGMCIFNLSDLGIALGSAVSLAADFRIDNRLMYTVGYAANKLSLLGRDVKITIGIPLSASGKNIFFDRKLI